MCVRSYLGLTNRRAVALSKSSPSSLIGERTRGETPLSFPTIPFLRSLQTLSRADRDSRAYTHVAITNDRLTIEYQL